MKNTLLPITSDYLLRDEKHRRFWFRLLLTEPNLNRFYYQLASANIITTPTVRSIYIPFEREAQYLQTEIEEKFLKVYPYLSNGMVSAVLIGMYDKTIDLSIDDAVELLSLQLARMFDLDRKKWEEVSREAEKHTKRISYKMDGFNAIKITLQ